MKDWTVKALHEFNWCILIIFRESYHIAWDVSTQFTIPLTSEFNFFFFFLINICSRVKLQNHPAVLSIRAEVVDQCLELFDLQVC